MHGLHTYEKFVFESLSLFKRRLFLLVRSSLCQSVPSVSEVVLLVITSLGYIRCQPVVVLPLSVMSRLTTSQRSHIAVLAAKRTLTKYMPSIENMRGPYTVLIVDFL